VDIGNLLHIQVEPVACPPEVTPLQVYNNIQAVRKREILQMSRTPCKFEVRAAR
jgi:hypothetical protein